MVGSRTRGVAHSARGVGELLLGVDFARLRCMRTFLLRRIVLMMVCVLLGATLLEARSDRRTARNVERATSTARRSSAAGTRSDKGARSPSESESSASDARLAKVYRPKNEALPPELQQHLKKVEAKADAFAKAVTRRSPRFKGEFTVGIVFVNFPDCDMGVCTAAGRITILHGNIPNSLSRFTSAVASEGVNIAGLMNKSRGKYAYTMLDLDHRPSDAAVESLRSMEGVLRVRVIK